MKSFFCFNRKKTFPVDTNRPRITFGKLHEDVRIPSKRREDAGLDIYAYFEEDFKIIPPHQTVIFNTGLVSHFSEDWLIKLDERGSTGTLGIGQRAGIIDSGYRGEWTVPITNTTNKCIIITKGDIKIDEFEKKARWGQYVYNFGLNNIDDIILYPYTKAICQAIVHKNYDVDVDVDSVENVKAVPSARGSGKLGSSGK